MKFNLGRALTIARREYLTTVRRKAFVFSLLLTPAIFGVTTLIQLATAKSAARVALKVGTMAVVDSTGEFADAPRLISFQVNLDEGGQRKGTAPGTEQRTARIEFLPDQKTAIDALRADRVQQVLVIPPDYLKTGKLRRFKMSTNMLSSADQRLIERWLVRGLLGAQVDSLRAERVARPSRDIELWTPDKAGRFELHDDKRDMIDVFVPLIFGMLLSVAIVTGGQYLLQGVNEEKESRILESLMCTVAPSDLMFGKLVGLGGAGLTLVGAWVAMGGLLAAQAAMFTQFHPSMLLLVFGIPYFLLGYLFYASIMTGIGAIANNLREAQQIAITFTMANFIPMYTLWAIISDPNGKVAFWLSMFPMTAPTTMMMRLAATNGGVPLWQLGASLGLLAVAAWIAVFVSSRIFRVGMLLYGKTPNLPEIMRWVRQG